ncbi:hypothetical protein BHM03_00045740 [Ensete ventricosum]|nr:hypothetical protein BHM03_00045740 [Ensete ventricosum]
MDNKLIDLRDEVRELKEGPSPMTVATTEQCAINLQAKVERLKAELGSSSSSAGSCNKMWRTSTSILRILNVN